MEYITKLMIITNTGIIILWIDWVQGESNQGQINTQEEKNVKIDR